MDAVPVVWIQPARGPGVSSGATGAERPRQADRALEEWGRARGVVLVAPELDRVAELHVDASIADSVEAELEKARDSTSALDADGAERSLARAETLLRDHPELPQGAWLMAEVERGWSMRWARVTPRQPERASAAWRRARGLDGGRTPGLGEEAAPTADPEVSFSLALDGTGHVRLDGLPVGAGPLRATAGEHQVTVTRKEHLIWAGWVSVSEGGTIRVALPESPRCSIEELSRVRQEARGLGVSPGEHGALHAEGVVCDRWVVAAPWTREGTVLVATCVMDHCSALLEWSIGGTGPRVPPDDSARRSGHWPQWATWALIGAGAAAIAGVTIGIDEAFQSGQPAAPFAVGGKKVTR